MADPPHPITSPTPIPHPQLQKNYQGFSEKLVGGIEANPQNDIEMEASAAMFQTAGFGSYNSSQQHNVVNTTQQNQITHQLLLGELARMYEALVQKIVMENRALMDVLRAENRNIKHEVETLRNEVRSTYLAQRIPEIIPNVRPSQTTETENGKESSTLKPDQPAPKNAEIPARPTYRETPQVISMAKVAAINAPTAEKPANWSIVHNRKGSKKKAPKNDFPAPMKSVDAAKRRVIFLRSPEAPRATGSEAQDILYALNTQLLSLKVPAHLRLVKLGYNERGNLTGLTTEQTTAEIMISLFQEVFVKSALRYDHHVKEVTSNQQWIGLKVHTVEIGRYHPAGGLEQIRREVATGPSALELPFTPRWIVHPTRMEQIVRDGTQLHSSIKVTVKTNAEAERILKQGLHFGGKFHKAEPYIPVGPDTMCTVCCHWGHITHGCPNPEKVRCAICAEQHLTTSHKCPIAGCKSPVGKFCKLHGSYKCVNCGESHSALASKCVDHRRAVAISKTDRNIWREHEKMHGESNTQEDEDIFSEPDNDMELELEPESEKQTSNNCMEASDSSS